MAVFVNSVMAYIDSMYSNPRHLILGKNLVWAVIKSLCSLNVNNSLFENKKEKLKKDFLFWDKSYINTQTLTCILSTFNQGVNIPDIDEEYPDITVYDLWDPDKIQEEKVKTLKRPMACVKNFFDLDIPSISLQYFIQWDWAH